MQKVPVGGSIAHAFEFLFGRFFQIIGTAWLPALLYGIGSFVYLTNMKPMAPIVPGQPVDTMMLVQVAGVALLIAAIATMIRSVINISLTQEALGVKKDLTLAHFVIGPRELRLFFAQIRFFILFLVLYAAVIAVSFGAMYAAKKYGAGLAPNLAFRGHTPAELAAAALAVVLLVWFALAMLRIVFILPAVASVEHRTRLARAWEVTGGSGWRILIVCIVIFLPVAALGCVALYFLVGPNDVMNLMSAMSKAKPGTPPPVGDFYAAHAMILSVFGAVMTVINSALLAGASAHAYRATTGHEDPEAEDDAALVAPLIAPVDAHGGHDDHGHGGHDDGHGHGGHDDHGHGGGHDDHGHGNGHGGHDDHGHGGHDDHGHGNGHGGGHDDHGHGGGGHDDAHGHGGGHDDHGHGNGHGGHDDHGHGGGGHGHDDHGNGGHDDHGHGGGHDDHGHGGGGHGHDDHGHGGHGHDDHGHGHGHGDGHHHHAKAA